MRKRETENAKETKGAYKLPFLLSKILTIICYLCVQAHLYAQTNVSIHLTAEATPAHCQADGCIQCHLSDTAGLNLEQIRYTFTPLSGTDSIVETTQPRITHLRPDRYRVTVSALYRTGLGHEDAYRVLTDTIEQITVGSLYTIPSSGVQRNLYSSTSPYGTVPSIACLPTGKLQLQLQNGTFPYTIDIWKVEGTDTLPYRNIVFDTLQHHGDNPQRADYRHYYTIDSLGAGIYQILFHDGCGYYTPLLFAEVPTATLNNDVHSFHLRNSPMEPSSTNLIVLKETIRGDLLLNNPSYYYYYNEEPMFEYRFINPTKSTFADTTRWLPLPNTTPDVPTYIIDTLSDLSCYGEVWMKSITLQYRVRVCPDTIWSSNFTIYPQGRNSILDYSEFYFYPAPPASFDYCTYSLPDGGYSTIRSRYYLSHTFTSINTCGPDSLNLAHPSCYTDKNSISNKYEGMSYHAYFTLPVKYKVTDLTTHEVVTTGELTSDYNWVYIYRKDYHLNNHDLCFEITDALGCPLYAVVKESIIDTILTEASTFRMEYPWTYYSEHVQECSESDRGVGLFQIGGELSPIHEQYLSYDGDTLMLVQSPLSNKYNFKAYKARTAEYHVEREQLDNTASIEFHPYRLNNSFKPGLYMHEKDLPSGQYVWVIVHACDKPNDTLVQTVVFPESPTLLTPPKYQFIQECSQLKIVPQSGQYGIDGVGIRTFFQAHLHDTLSHSLNSVPLDDTIIIGVPGTYHLSMYALPLNNAALLESNPCYITDTLITWDARTVEYDYLISYVCNASDSIGFVRARGKYGLRPHTYTLYSAPSGTGALLGQNAIGDFNGLPIHFGQQLSIDIRDNCNAHFLTNFTVSDMEHIRKAWMEDNDHTAILYEGDTCHLYSISMGEVNYHWTGPNDFQDDTQRPLFCIPNGPLAAGTYAVTIEGSGCSSAQDSVQLFVIKAPTVRLDRDTVVCPGTEIPIIATVVGDSIISYAIIKQAFGRRDTFLLANRPPGHSDTLWTSITDDNTRFYVSDVHDNHRSYHAATDTVHVYLINNLNEILISSTSDTVCRGEDATLTAAVNILPPYTIQWREINNHSVIQTDTINAIGAISQLHLTAIEQETSYSAHVLSINNCRTQNGIFQEVKMDDQTVTVANNQGVRFYDSGGSSAPYAPTESSITTFICTDSTFTLSMQFEYFNCSDATGTDNSDVLYIFDGASTDGVLLHTLHGRIDEVNLPNIISNSGSLTCWFISNHLPNVENNAYEGWCAIIQSSNTDTSTITREASSLSTISIKGDTYHETRTIEISEDDLPYDWDGIQFTHADTLIERNTSQSGCDSTVVRILKVKSLAPCPTAIDYDGNEYPSVRIGVYCWTQTNLTSQHYSDGRTIANASGYFADIYPDSTSNIQTFGRLYDWYASIDTANLTPTSSGHLQGACPYGWYLPSVEQYESLNNLGSSALRSPDYWLDGGGSNSSGFSSLPAGFYNGEHQRFENLLGEAYFWADSVTDFSENSIYLFGNTNCKSLQKLLSDQHNRYSIRCIFDE